jgi:YHS domain-containing protein
MSKAFRVLRRATLAVIFIVTSPVAASAADGAKPAIQGYDPVNYFTEGRPTKGTPEFSHIWDGERYFFASAKNRDMFAADPVLVPNPEHWIIIDGKLYLFGKDIGPTAFRANPGLVKKSEENWPRIRKATD